MRRDFKGGVYWDEYAETCGEISGAAGFRGAVRFQENTVCGNGTGSTKSNVLYCYNYSTCRLMFVGTKFCICWDNMMQKYQTLILAKYSHLKI